MFSNIMRIVVILSNIWFGYNVVAHSFNNSSVNVKIACVVVIAYFFFATLENVTYKWPLNKEPIHEKNV